MSKIDLSDVYRDYIACLNEQDWPKLAQFVHDEVYYNGRPIGLASRSEERSGESRAAGVLRHEAARRQRLDGERFQSGGRQDALRQDDPVGRSSRHRRLRVRRPHLQVDGLDPGALRRAKSASLLPACGPLAGRRWRTPALI